MSEKLSAKHQEFIRQYLSNGFNATEAYRTVYPNNKNPDVDGPRLLGNAGIQAEIKKHQTKTVKKFEISQERIIRELAAIALGNAGDFFEWNESRVKLVPKARLTKTQLKFVEAVKETTTEYGGSIELKTLAGQKVKALELLGRHVGMWKEKDAGHGADSESQRDVLKRVHELFRKRKERPRGSDDSQT